MKTAILFPGTDALEEATFRKQALRIPRVREALDEAQAILDGSEFQALDLARFMVSESNYGPIWFQELAVATLAVQTALFRDYLDESARPDVLMGCSLGDIARSVCSGAATLETAVLLMAAFALQVTKIQDGAVAVVVSKEPLGFEAVVIPTLLPYQLEASVYQTPKHLLIAGPARALQRWILEVAVPRGLKAKMIYPYPLHTRYMAPAVEPLKPRIQAACAQAQWDIPMMSSLFCRILRTREELAQDAVANVTSAVRWQQSFEVLVVQEKVEKFVSLGPAPTLLRFIAHSPHAASVLTEDYFARRVEQVSMDTAPEHDGRVHAYSGALA